MNDKSNFKRDPGKLPPRFRPKLHHWIRRSSWTTFAIAVACVAASNRPSLAFQSDLPIEIPFELTKDNLIVVLARINDTETLRLMLHTASTDLHLTEDAVKNTNSVQFTAEADVEAWGGESVSRLSRNNCVQIGGIRREEIQIWENKLSGPETDGKFGLDFFGKKKVEVDFARRLIIVRDELPDFALRFEQLEISQNEGQWLVEARCIFDDRSYSHPFLIHSGYSGGILLDDEYAAEIMAGNSIKILDQSNLQDSFGNLIQIKKGVLPKLGLGGILLTEVPAGFFSGAERTQKLSVLGAGVLSRFHIIFDLANRRLYLTLRAAEH